MDQLDVDLYGTPERTAALMAKGGTWAVVGLSNNRTRAAWGVAAFLIERGVRVVPIHPHAEVVHGQQGYATLGEAAVAVGHIDLVDIFVRSSLAGAVVDSAIEIGADAVWLQLGVIDEPAAGRARAAGLLTVMDQCPAQIWDLLLPRGGASDGAGVAAGPTITPDDGGEACAWAPPPRFVV